MRKTKTEIPFRNSLKKILKFQNAKERKKQWPQ